MRAKFILFFVFLILSFQSFTNPSDSLVKYSELAFSSDFEKENFEKLFIKKESLNFLTFLMGCNATTTTSDYKAAQDKIERIYKELEKEGVHSKSEAKKIKTIYSKVHDSFLKKYELQNNFYEIFTTGNYNCLSATALYSLFLDKFKIPYTIKETPNHVFLVTYPDTYKILIETTDPVKGFYRYDESVMKKYAEHLKKSKLISEQEFATKSGEEIFNQYFFKQEDINLKQLVGLQYYNLALFAYEKENYLESYQLLQKGYFFNPSKLLGFMLKNSLLNLLSRSDYTKEESIKQYVTLSRFISGADDEINSKMLIEEFGNITEKQLISKSNFELYTRNYNYISSNISDTTLRKGIDFIYNYEVARAVLNSGKSIDVKENLVKIYKLKPEHIDVQGLIISFVLKDLMNMNNPKTILNNLNTYSADFPFLSEHQKFVPVYAGCYLQVAGESFAENNPAKGEKELIAFENFMKGKDKSILQEYYVERCYSEAAASFYRKGNYAKTKAIVKKGLEFYPESNKLKSMLKSLN